MAPVENTENSEIFLSTLCELPQHLCPGQVCGYISILKYCLKLSGLTLS